MCAFVIFYFFFCAFVNIWNTNKRKSERNCFRPPDRCLFTVLLHLPVFLKQCCWLGSQHLKLKAELMLIQATLRAQAVSLKRWVCPIGHRLRQNQSWKTPKSMPLSLCPHAALERHFRASRELKDCNDQWRCYISFDSLWPVFSIFLSAPVAHIVEHGANNTTVTRSYCWFDFLWMHSLG